MRWDVTSRLRGLRSGVLDAVPHFDDDDVDDLLCTTWLLQLVGAASPLCDTVSLFVTPHLLTALGGSSRASVFNRSPALLSPSTRSMKTAPKSNTITTTAAPQAAPRSAPRCKRRDFCGGCANFSLSVHSSRRQLHAAGAELSSVGVITIISG